MNRGSAAFLLVERERESASMRPRFMNRGSLAWSAFGKLETSSFNEAPIHESGKYQLGVPLPPER